MACDSVVRRSSLISEIAIAAWIRALASPDFEVRDDARRHLHELGELAVDPLIAAVKTAEGRQSWEAASLLAHIDDARVWGLMCDLLNSSNVIVTQVAAQALARYGEQSVPVLVKALPVSRELTQIEILGALETIGSRCAVVPLLEFLKQPHSAHSAMLRYTAIQALGKLGDPQAIEVIRSFQNDEDSHVRKRVRIALQTLEHRTSQAHE